MNCILDQLSHETGKNGSLGADWLVRDVVQLEMDPQRRGRRTNRGTLDQQGSRKGDEGDGGRTAIM